MTKTTPGGHIADDTAAALGGFMITWSLLEAILEVGIHRQLGLSPIKSSIVTAGLQFRARASMLLSLLNLEPKANGGAIKCLKTLISRSERNDFAHSTFLYEPGHLSLIRRRVDNKFKSEIRSYSNEELTKLKADFEQMAFELAAELGLSPRDFNPYFHSAHNAANKASGSP